MTACLFIFSVSLSFDMFTFEIYIYFKFIYKQNICKYDILDDISPITCVLNTCSILYIWTGIYFLTESHENSGASESFQYFTNWIILQTTFNNGTTGNFILSMYGSTHNVKRFL